MAFIGLKNPKFMHKLGIMLLLLVTGLAVPAYAESDDVVIFETEQGRIVIELFPEDAPNHVENFITLSETGFYNNTAFHRIIPGFMIQGGDPLTKLGESMMDRWGSGGPEHMVSQEFNDIKHVRGIVSMARSNDPDSAGSQFFIVHADSPHLDGQYTVFGRVVTQESLDTLDIIALMDTVNTRPIDWEQTRITSVDVAKKSDIKDLLELGAPARTSQQITVGADNLYRNEDLGIEFKAPIGWLIQEPQKTNPEVPDVVAVTAGTSMIHPSIAITVSPSQGRTLEQIIEERKELLKPVIESDQLRITGEEYQDMFGRNVYTIDALGTFVQGNMTAEARFTEITFIDDQRSYTVTYTTESFEYDTYYDDFIKSVEDLKTPNVTSPVNLKADDLIENNDKIPNSLTEPETNPEDNGCLIATATYGSEMAPQVQLLRELRDDTVLTTQSGSTFMSAFNQVYYLFSPTVADWERQNPVFRDAVKITITPLLSTLALLNHVGIDSEIEMIGYGIGVIAMNIAMYVAAPIAVLYRVIRR